MKKTKLLLLFIFLNILFINLLPLNVNSQPLSDLSYTFDDNILYENNTITEFDDSFNLRNSGFYSQVYNASYSFTDNPNGTIGNDILFIDSIDTQGIGSSLLINDSFVGHDNILGISVPISSTGLFTTHDFDTPNQAFGFIEFWWVVSDVNEQLRITFNNGGTIVFRLAIFAGDIQLYDGSWNILAPVVNNEWNHVLIYWEATAGGFNGLNQFETQAIINGTDIGVFGFENNEANVDDIQFQSLATEVMDTYFDAIGFSWLTNYTESLNIFPFLNVSETLQEVDKYEFALNDINTFNVVGSQDPNGWETIELFGATSNIQPGLGGLDMRVICIGGSNNDVAGLSKDNLGFTGKFINVSVEYVFSNIAGNTNEFDISLYSSDGVLISLLRIFSSGVIRVFDDSTFIDLTSIITISPDIYDFNIFINYELDRVFLIVRKDDIVIETIDYTTIDFGKNGLDKVIVDGDQKGANPFTFFIQNIGIYDNGVSQVENGIDFGIAQIDLVNTWHFQNNNLINIIGNGTFHLGVNIGEYLRFPAVFTEVSDTSVYSNVDVLINVYDGFISTITNPVLVITVIGGFFIFSSLKIDGVLLNESSNSYNLIFEHGNVDTNESFFNVVNNKLMFTHNSNDTNLEFIQARFSINPVSSTDYTISFNSVIQNNAFGFLRVNFTDVSNLIQMPNIERVSRFVLIQNLTIHDFIILITDRDIDSVSGFTTGSINNIQLLITQNIGISIITSALIDMMIPIIMILIPTLALANRYGRNLIIPMFLLMSVICVVSGLIPVWLFFIIAISSSVFLLKLRSENL